MVQPEGAQVTSQYGAYKLHAELAMLHARTRMHTPRARAHARTHARTRVRTHTHKYVIFIAFPRQQ